MFFILKCKKVVFFFLIFVLILTSIQKFKKKNLKLEQKSNIQSLL